MNTEEKRRHLRQRLMNSVSVDGNGCWIWQKCLARNGYGSFALGAGKNVRAHRISYELFIGPIPDGLDICHRCDVRPCVNPAHLFAGTRSENIRDAVAKGRVNRTIRARGSAHPSSKLTEDSVSAILRALRFGEQPASLARQFGVTHRTIALIRDGRAWKHVEAA